jgi:hypothetical protein
MLGIRRQFNGFMSGLGATAAQTARSSAFAAEPALCVAPKRASASFLNTFQPGHVPPRLRPVE